MKQQQQIKEIWKPSPNYSGFYEVSNFGNLRSVTADLLSTFNIKSDKRGVGGSVYVGKRGYPVANLRKNNKVKSVKIHRLVATAFIPNPTNLPYVNHKDGNKTNNHVSNLEWVSAAENIQHSFKVLGFRGSAYGTKGGTCSKKVDQYTLDGIYLNTYASATEAATRIGITTAAISNCLRGKSRSCAGYSWRLNINKLDVERADQAIAKLRKVIEDREEEENGPAITEGQRTELVELMNKAKYDKAVLPAQLKLIHGFTKQSEYQKQKSEYERILSSSNAK